MGRFPIRCYFRGLLGFVLLALVTLSIKNPAVAAAGNNAFIVAIQQAVEVVSVVYCCG